MNSKMSVNLSFERQEMVIPDTEYAGEMKKDIFPVMHYLITPLPNAPSGSCRRCTARPTKGRTATCRFFWVSGMGKSHPLCRPCPQPHRRPQALLEQRGRLPFEQYEDMAAPEIVAAGLKLEME